MSSSRRIISSRVLGGSSNSRANKIRGSNSLSLRPNKPAALQSNLLLPKRRPLSTTSSISSTTSSSTSSSSTKRGAYGGYGGYLPSSQSFLKSFSPPAATAIASASVLNLSGLATSAAAAQQVFEKPQDVQSVLGDMNERMQGLESDPLGIIRWTMEEFDGRVAMSTSFGIQSAVLLHAATQVYPDIPVVWVDTGYLPKETYEYAETLRETLGLNLIIKSNDEWSSARMEALYGKLWEKEDVESHTLYGRLRKVVPMNAGLDSIKPNPRALLSGLRAAQTKARANMPLVGFQNERFKVLPLLKMSDEQVEQYMDMYDLPHHPLASQGYVTVGDWHSSRPVQEGEDARNTRFGGKFEECGLHVEEHTPESESVTSSANEGSNSHSGSQTVEVDNITTLASAKATGVMALETTTAHPETDMAVVMVKKVMEDGSYCRKCNDVAEKMATDDVAKWIGYTANAEVLNSDSEGSRIAKHFDVATAPFFLVRSIDEQKNGDEWKIVRSYLQLRKKLLSASEQVEEKALLAEKEGAGSQSVKESQEFKEATSHLRELHIHVERLQRELALSQKKMDDTAKFFEKKFQVESSDLGL